LTSFDPNAGRLFIADLNFAGNDVFTFRASDA